MKKLILTVQWIINLIFRIPIVFIAGILHALSDFLERIAERIDQIEEMVQALVILPAIQDIDNEIKKRKEEIKLEALRKLRGSLDK